MGWVGLANRTLNFHKSDINHYVKQANGRSMYSYFIEALDGKIINGVISFNRPDFLSDAAPVPVHPNQQWPAGPRTLGTTLQRVSNPAARARCQGKARRGADASFWTDKKETENNKLDSIVLKAVCDWIEDEWPIDIVMFSVKKYNKRQEKIMRAAKLKAFDPELGEYQGMFDKCAASSPRSRMAGYPRTRVPCAVNTCCAITRGVEAINGSQRMFGRRQFWFQRTGIDVDLFSLPLPIMGEDQATVALREFRKIKGLTDSEKEQLAAYKAKYANEAFEQGFCKKNPCTDEEIKNWGRVPLPFLPSSLLPSSPLPSRPCLLTCILA